jgi:DMSO reductase family type II enzyme heme b subunit
MMKKFRITAFWQAILVIVCAYLFFDNAFPPVMPKSLMIEFMIITVIGVLLYFSFDDKRWDEFKAPIKAVLRDDDKWVIRWAFLIFIPVLLAYSVHNMVKPSFEPPVELRQVHPAPPSSLRVYDKSYNLTTLENPIRAEVLAQSDAEAAEEIYREAVQAGSLVYFQNCFYCHGDLLDGDGPFAAGFNPLPANFQDVGTIAQLQEAFLFWRITTGGPGLPKEGTPWNSAMPVWHEMLSEEEVWQVITFLYDYVGQVPRMWDAEVSKAVTGMKDKIQSQRAKMTGAEIYQFRCAECHGEEGAGDGPAADFLYPRPRDFALGIFKYKTSPGELPARDEDLFNTIKHGLNGTSMPGWARLLSDEQINSLIPVLKGFDIAGTWEPEDEEDEDDEDDAEDDEDDAEDDEDDAEDDEDDAEDEDDDDEEEQKPKNFIRITEIEPTEGQIPYSAESIAKGKIAFEKTCEQCHGHTGRGNITSGKRLADDWGYRVWPRNLTQPWTWRASNDENSREMTIRNIYLRLSIGIFGTPMPAHRSTSDDPDPVSLEDRWHIANYVYSLRENSIPPGESSVIKGMRIEGALPSSVDDAAWDKAAGTTMRLVPNIIKEERLFRPLASAVTARVLYNNQEIAFLLEVDDRTDSRPGEPVSEQIQDETLEMHSDAFAIQFPKAGAFETAPMVEKPLYRHGDARHPTTIWYWNAGSIDPEKAMILDGKGTDKKLEPRPKDNSLVVTGKWEDGRWRILMKRSRKGGESGDLSFSEGQFIPVSFANWDGSNGEIGSKHTLTSWYWLLLPPLADPMKIYGMPLGIGFLTFLLGIVLVHRR